MNPVTCSENWNVNGMGNVPVRGSVVLDTVNVGRVVSKTNRSSLDSSFRFSARSRSTPAGSERVTLPSSRGIRLRA